MNITDAQLEAPDENPTGNPAGANDTGTHDTERSTS
jgi:hypothetical protein